MSKANRVYAITVRPKTDGARHIDMFVVAPSESPAIAKALKEAPGSIASCSDIGTEDQLEPKAQVIIEINEHKFTYDQPGLLAANPNAKILR